MDGHVGLDMVLGVEAPITYCTLKFENKIVKQKTTFLIETNLEWLLPCVSSLVSLLGRVVSEELPAVLTRMSLHAGVHLLMMSPLDPLVKSLATDGTCLELQFYLVSVKMLDQVYGHRVCLHLYDLRAQLTPSPSVVLGEAFKMLPHLLPPLLPDLGRSVLND